MSSTSFDKLSLEEIEKRLNSLESDKVALRQALEYKQEQGKRDLAEQIKEMIEASEYEMSEIVDLIVPKRRGGGRSKSNRSYTRYVDPANPKNTYVRGVLPGWMKDQMADKGLNPKDKADREVFKEQHLQKMDG